MDQCQEGLPDRVPPCFLHVPPLSCPPGSGEEPSTGVSRNESE